MATTTVDGTTYTIPDNGDRGWGTESSNLLKALGDNSLLIKGGSIPLTSDADFGANFGLKSIYFVSRTANAASAGVLRLANTDVIGWRNGANNADLSLSVASDRLQYEGVDIADLSTTQVLTNKTYDASLNTLSNVDTTMLAAGVLITSTTLTGAADTNFPSTLAVKTYIDNAIDGQNDASEISYTPTTPGDWPDPDPTTVQGGLDKNATRLITAENHIASTSNPHTVTATQVGLGNVDNTSDANKPVSTATQTALDLKEDDLGNPTVDGYVLSSTIAGARSWIAPGGGGSSNVTTDTSTSNLTVASGETLTHPFLTVDTGDVYTITGRAIIPGNLTINGTMTVTGTVYVTNLN